MEVQGKRIAPPAGQQEILLEAIDLTKHFSEVVANDNVSLEVRKGEIHCLLGENGAGKSTLAETLYGFYQPDSGEIRFKGQPVTISSPSDAIELGIGMVHQHFELVEPHSVLENIILGTEPKGVLLGINGAEKHIRELCEQYDVTLDPHAKIWQLSVGEQQWVEILKALYEGIELLILDEPTAVLTPQESERLFATLKRMSTEGLSIIFITHKLKEVMSISDRVTVLRRGKRVATVNTQDVTKEDLARMMVGREVIFRVQKEEVSSGEPLLQIKNLHARNDRGQMALHGIDLTVHQHEILGIAGVAGNGQKELFETLVGVRRAEQGEVLINGENVANKSPSYILPKGVGYIPDDRIKEGLVLEFSVSDNVILGHEWQPPYRRLFSLDFNYIKQFVSRMISTFEIASPSASHPTKHLSGGNLQKVILARELGHDPQVLLANQPTRGLDVGVIEYVHGQLLEKRKEGLATLLISEDLDEIFSLSDRIAVMYRGEIVGLFPVAEAQVDQVGLLMAGITEGEA